jgi:hypothetical protein
VAILINPVRKTLTASSGAASDTFSAIGTCQQIVVTPTTSTTGYDFSITDADSVVVFQMTDEVGTMNEDVDLPLAGTYTIALANATVDEAHKVLIKVRNS